MIEKQILSVEQVGRYGSQGYLVVEDFFDTADVQAAVAGINDCFDGIYEAGVAPEFPRNDVDGHVVNRNLEWGWKANYAIANLVLCRKLGQALTQLNGAGGVRLKQDSLVWKGPGALCVNHHQDNAYRSTVPGNATTAGILLTGCSPASGGIEYVPGSHKWPMRDVTEQAVLRFRDLRGDGDYRLPARLAAAREGIDLATDEFVQITANSGAVVFHDGNMWHGSGANSTVDQHRMLLFAFTVSDEDYFPEEGSSEYNVQMVRRYKDPGSLEMAEAHFPILWRDDGYRTPWLDPYLGKAAR